MDINLLFETVADSISLSPNEIQEAESKRAKLTNLFLNNSPTVELYIQGSFASGTAVKPIKTDKDGDFDLDLVCDVKKQYSEAKSLKNEVGDIIKKSGYVQYLDEEGKRCWTLVFERFHIDLLPSFQKLPITDTAIQITNKNKKDDTYSFKPSNPKGLLKWFLDINNLAYSNMRNNYASNLYQKNYKFFYEDMKYASWDKIDPKFISLPMQNAIKIMKRHRDILFVNKVDEEYKPISVIINVLVAKLVDIYKPKSIYQIITQFCEKFSSLFSMKDGHLSLTNPVDSDEILTDRWREDNYAREIAFLKWVKSLEELVKRASSTDEINSTNLVMKYFGEDSSQKYKSILGERMSQEKKQIGAEKMPKPWNR